MEFVTDWWVLKCTTDKLEGLLSEQSDKGREVHTVTHVGGRDWVVVACRDVPAEPPVMGTFRTHTEAGEGHAAS